MVCDLSASRHASASHCSSPLYQIMTTTCWNITPPLNQRQRHAATYSLFIIVPWDFCDALTNLLGIDARHTKVKIIEIEINDVHCGRATAAPPRRLNILDASMTRSLWKDKRHNTKRITDGLCQHVNYNYPTRLLSFFALCSTFLCAFLNLSFANLACFGFEASSDDFR